MRPLSTTYVFFETPVSTAWVMYTRAGNDKISNCLANGNLMAVHTDGEACLIQAKTPNVIHGARYWEASSVVKGA
jgi:hypothetical protein